MSLRTLIRPGLVACTKETLVRDLVQLMEDENVGAVLVLENERPIGIVTDRDVALRCLGKDTEGIVFRAQDVMSKSPDCVKIDSGMVRGAIDYLRFLGVRRLVLAIPTCARDTLDEIRELVDRVVCLSAPRDFRSVGDRYDEFPQLSDADVLELLRRDRERRTTEYRSRSTPG